MAKVNFGPIVSDARGKVGTVVFMPSRNGPTARAWLKPTNPRSPYQLSIRTTVKTLSKKWFNTLTPQQRAAWIDYSTSRQLRGKLANTIRLTGVNAFVQNNLNSLYAGGTTILDPPTDYQATDPGPLTVAASAAAGSLTCTPTNPLPTGYGFIARATPNLSPGVYNFTRYLLQLWPYPSTFWNDNFPNTHPVPPWLQGPVYTPTNWTEATNTLTVTWDGNLNHIYSPTLITNPTITCQYRMTNDGPYSTALTARVNPTTGQQYWLNGSMQYSALWLNTYDDWHQANPRGVASITYTWDTKWHTLTWTINGTNHLITIDGTTAINATDTYITTAGAVGLATQPMTTQLKTYLAQQGPTTPPSLPNLGPAYIYRFGNLTAGKQIAVLLAYVNLTTGARSPAQMAVCTIAP